MALAKGTTNGQPVFDERQFFTRAGDVALDKDGYLVNGAGYYLQGWPADAAGNPDRTILNPIRVNQQVFNPVATTKIDLAANLPADATTAPVTTQAQVYDSLGRLHTVNLSFTSTATNAWSLALDGAGRRRRRPRAARSGCASAPAPRPRSPTARSAPSPAPRGSVGLPATSGHRRPGRR